MNGTIANQLFKRHYLSNGIDFAEKARAEALKMQQEMEAIISVKFKVLSLNGKNGKLGLLNH
jgi:hypothetical protein